MFNAATSFNGDISMWDVSRVVDMDYMFLGATSFKRNLCDGAWPKSKASKIDMFMDSPGFLSYTPTFSSKAELTRAVVACMELSQEGDFTNGSPLTPCNMNRLFEGVE